MSFKIAELLNILVDIDDFAAPTQEFSRISKICKFVKQAEPGELVISLFLLLLWEHPQFTHDPKQVLRPTGIAALFQAVPQLN